MKLYHNATILTMDQNRRIFSDGAIAVDGNTIAEVGSSIELQQRYPSAERIDCHQNILMPGLINTHLHLAQCLLRGMADDMEILPWLCERIWPVQGAYDHETFLHSANLGISEMLLGGTTTFIESMFAGHYGIEGLIDAVDRSGIRAMISKIVMKPKKGALLPPSMTEEFEESIQAALQAKKRYDGMFNDQVRIWLGPRWTAMFDTELMQRVSSLMRDEGFYATLHFAESPEDVQAIKDATGLSPAEFLKEMKVPGKQMVLVHCTSLPKGDEHLLAEQGFSLSYCAVSTMKTAMGVCRANDCYKAGVNVTIGTDAPACDNNADMFLAMRMGSLMQKHMTQDPVVFDAKSMLEMVTIRAAQAIGMDHLIGSLEKGKRADFIEIDLSHPRLRPVNNPESAVVYAATASDVKTVVIDGKTVVKDRILTTMDLSKIIEDAERTAAVMRKRVNA